MKIHKYAFEKVVYEMCMQLSGEDKHEAARVGLVKLLENVQIADSNVILHPIDKNSTEKAIGAPKDLPTNFTRLSKYVALPDSAKAFKPKPKRNQNKRGGRRSKKQEFMDPQIYPQVVMSSDLDPEEICKLVIHELSRMGFVWLRKKELQCISSSTYWLFFYLWNYGYIPMLRGDIERMLEMARDVMIQDGRMRAEEGSRSMPAINLRRAVPRLPGTDAS